MPVRIRAFADDPTLIRSEFTGSCRGHAGLGSRAAAHINRPT
jgi:hypothetical protein